MTNNSTTLALLACTLLCTAALAQQKGTFTDTRDGKTYKTVKIGEQVWMGENLNYEAEGSRCYGEGGKFYNEKTRDWDITLSNAEIQANCDKYGKLYSWKTAKKVCPNGWHLPSNAEWDTLVVAVSNKKTAGKYLKATSGWNSYKGKSGNGNDKYGFSALPGGFGFLNSDNFFFFRVGDEGYWWTADRFDHYRATYRSMFCCYEPDNVNVSCKDSINLFSVRCLQNR